MSKIDKPIVWRPKTDETVPRKRIRKIKRIDADDREPEILNGTEPNRRSGIKGVSFIDMENDGDFPYVPPRPIKQPINQHTKRGSNGR